MKSARVSTFFELAAGSMVIYGPIHNFYCQGMGKKETKEIWRHERTGRRLGGMIW